MIFEMTVPNVVFKKINPAKSRHEEICLPRMKRTITSSLHLHTHHAPPHSMEGVWTDIYENLTVNSPHQLLKKMFLGAKSHLGTGHQILEDTK